jgi:hypothetical protein
MRHTRKIVAVLLLSALQGLTGQPRSSSDESASTSQRSEDAMIESLGHTLAPTGKKVRVYFHGACSIGKETAVLFPRIELQPVAAGRTGVDRARERFRNAKNVSVVDDGSGIVRVRIGSVSPTILNTRITSLKLSEDAQYNPDGPGGAIDLMEGTAAIKTAMEKLKVEQVPVFYIGLMEPNLKTLPHLPPEMHDTTADQMLDQIAKTFAGVVVYGECSRPDGAGLIDLEFYWLKKPSTESQDNLPH